MLALLNIPAQCIRPNCDHSTPLKSGFKDDSAAWAEYVHSIKWYASLKPPFMKAKPVKTQEIVYEEIQVFQVEVTEVERLFDISNAVYRQVRYPCILIIKYGEKYCVGACPFAPGKIDSDTNILRRQVFSHWIHTDLLSSGAIKFIHDINCSIELDDNLYDIYTRIYHLIQMFHLGGTTRAHVDLLLRDLLGKGAYIGKSKAEILQYCTPYKKHRPTEATIAAKYDKNKRTSAYIYSYDYEDIWYCLMKCEYTRNIIKQRKYRDIEDLIFSIDNKIFDSKW